MIDRNIAQAKEIGKTLVRIGYTLPTPVVLNQVLVRASDDSKMIRICELMQLSGAGWFGMSRWNGRAAFRICVSSHRTNLEHLTRLIAALEDALNKVGERSPDLSG